MQIIGRKDEKEILDAKIASGEPELIAVIGRRRVGKTYLIRTHCKDLIRFEFTGMHEASMRLQLENFSLAVQSASKSNMKLAVPENWLQAFAMLDTYIQTLSTKGPMVIFFDEFPWIDTPKSGFLKAFQHWWNTSASKKDHIKVIICGSSASWMIEKVLNDRGGLHNRVTQTIRLYPFTLGETQEFLQAKHIILDQYSQLQLYMAIGGIPHYLRNINKGESASQALDRLCFSKNAPLKNEYTNLYASLFADSQNHDKVIRALAAKGKGLTRNEIIEKCRFTSGGSTSRILQELEESGFITAYTPFQKNSKDSIYKLTDEYSLFYLKFIERPRDQDKGSWIRQQQSNHYTSWSGFAFESLCLKHIKQIKQKLGIEGVLTNASSWRYIPSTNGQGAQIDLLLDRQDRCINICEMKFYDTEFVIDKKYAAMLDNKINVFRSETGTKKTIFPTLVTTFGTRKNEYYLGRIQAEVVMEDLFK